MHKYLFIFALLLCSIDTHADSYLLLGQWSKHIRDKDYYNETHHLLGVEWMYNNNNSVHLSTYINSDSIRGYIVANRRQVIGEYRGGVNVSPSLLYGLVSGYEKADILPFVLPGVSVSKGRVGVDINCIPTVVISAGFRIRF